jgi:hypothetical protein
MDSEICSQKERIWKVCAPKFEVFLLILVLFAFPCQLWEKFEPKPLFLA